MDFSGSVQTSVFAYLLMAVVAMLTAVMAHGIVVVLQRAQQRSKAEIAPTAVSTSVAAAVDETAAHVAAITAAVYAHIGPHRLVHIHEVPRGPGWTAIARLTQHASHAPRRGSR